MEETATAENPKFEGGKLPFLRIRSLRIQNLKSYDDCTFDFLDNSFVCFIGPNGTGKSTALEVIQHLLSKHDGSEMDRLNAHLGKLVRHVKGRHGNIHNNDFLVTAQIESELGNYEVQINKSGFVKDHPPEIKERTYRLCYLSSIDKELHKFQLKKEKWGVFKELFENITGYEIEQQVDFLSSASFDPKVNEEMEKYILGFWVKKPHEKTFYRDCSDGERKVMKSISTMLNMDHAPRIILIDNIEMHVEPPRHMRLVQSLKKCFPESQIFATTHSLRISRNFKIQKEIYDLRWIHASSILKNEPWRLYCIDEIDEFLAKAECLSDETLSKDLIQNGIYIRKNLLETIDVSQLIEPLKKFTRDVEGEFIKDMLGLKSNQKVSGVNQKNDTIQ